MCVGEKAMDEDHKNLVLLFNELHDAVMTGRAKPELDDLLEGLVTFTSYHHAHEEQFVAKSGYQFSAEHQLEHDRMLDEFMDLQVHFASGKELAHYMEVMNGLRVSLFKHIQGSDHEFVAYLKAWDAGAILSAADVPEEIIPQAAAMGASSGAGPA
jgi:hemerythrin